MRRYVAYENTDGSVQEFTVDGGGALREVEVEGGGAAVPVATHGAHPCYLAKMNGVLLCANYSDGPASLVALPLLPRLRAAPPALRIKFAGG